MSVSPKVEEFVRRRADDRCEYCRMHQSLQGATFHVEHIVPQSKGGLSDEANLAIACPTCNLHKSDRLTAADPESLVLTPLFHPRLDNWHEHFEFQGFEVIGRTVKGRATIVTFELNHPRRQRIREAESRFDLFPPSDATDFA
jgi:hypothetical protein